MPLPLLLATLLAAPAPPVTTLSGHLEHAPAGDTVRLLVGVKRVKAPLSASGDFRFELPGLAAPTPVHFQYASQHTRLYLVPGDQLRLTLDYSDFDKSLVYSGRGADINNYLARSQYQFEYGPAGDVPRPQEQLRPTTTPAEMRRNADAFRAARRTYLVRYAQAHPLPPAFRREAEFAIDLAWGTQLLGYVGYSRAQHASEAGPGLPAVTPAYFSFMQQLPLRELGQHFGRGIDENTAVAQFLYAYQDRLAPAGQLSTDPAEGPRIYQLATQELGEGKIRDMAIQMLMTWKIDADLAGARAFYRTFAQHTADSALVRDVRTMLVKKSQLAIGQPAPAFTLVDNTGKAVSLSDFRGKVVYLDFWGTWCAPCMREMTEFSHDLKKQFVGRDVVFLYVSQGDAADKWQQTLADKQLTSPNSVHLREPRESQAVAAAYQVHYWPTYFLIGRDGRILDPTAPRPSDGAKTVAALEQALK